MKKIIILDVPSTRKDEIISSLIGTKWDVENALFGRVVINACGGLLLEKGEYELIEV